MPLCVNEGKGFPFSHFFLSNTVFYLKVNYLSSTVYEIRRIMEVRVGTSADVEQSLQVNTFTSPGWSCWAAAPVLEDAQTLGHSRLPK